MRPSGYSLILISMHRTPSVVSLAGTTTRCSPSSPSTLTAKALYARCTTVCVVGAKQRGDTYIGRGGGAAMKTWNEKGAVSYRLSQARQEGALSAKQVGEKEGGE